MTMVRDRVLGLFAKGPRPGQVKTRLAAATSPEWAARLAEAFLADTLDRLAHVDARRVLAYAPAEAVGDFAELVAGRFELRPQVEGQLGQRLQAFVTDCFVEGADGVVLVGADSPTIPIDCIANAFQELRRVDVVLGPATDGGYYLLGCARRVPPIFQDIPWSSSHVLAATVKLLQAAGLQMALLPPWYDVDTADDCAMLRGHLAAMRAAGQDPEVPHTEALLCNWPPC